MKTRNKIVLDRIIGRPAALLLDCIAWPLGKIIARDHDDSPSKVKNIAIAKLLGMGSILRATPMIKALKQKHPSARYIFITAYRNKPLMERLGLMDTCLYIRDTSFFTLFIDTGVLIFRLWQYRVDLYFDLEIYSAFSSILALLSLARNRYGFYKDTTFFRRGLNTHLVYFNDSQHISRIYLQLARACGTNNMYYKIERLKPQPGDIAEVKGWLVRNKLPEDTGYIVINPNASDLLLERRWPVDYFVALIDLLAISWHQPIYIVGSPEEHMYVSTLHNKLSPAAKKVTFNTAGVISFGAAVALISKARIMLTNDSGLYHIATSLEIPVVSLWGPGDPDHYADHEAKNNEIFYCKDIYCSPCLYKTDFPPCRGNNACMKSIAPKEVYKKICKLLNIDASANTSKMDMVYAKEKYQDLDITLRLPRKKAQ